MTFSRLSAAAALPLALIFSCSAHAMLYQMAGDASLYDRSDAVVIGQVSSAAADAADPASITRYALHIEESLKGGLTDGISLRVPGAFDRTRAGALIVPGAPHFTAGERALLFLHQRGDGEWTVSQFALGAFHVKAADDGSQTLERDLTEAHDTQLKSGGAEPAGQVRDLARFRQWLLARAAGQAADENYWTASAAPAVALKFATEGAPAARWFEFDNGNSVILYAGSSGQSGVTGGGYEQLQQAIAAWNDDSASNVRYVYGGISAASGGLSHADGINSVLFNDPDGDIGGSFDCIGGGVLAYSGFRTLGTRTYNGATFSPIVEVDTVVQDGAGCSLAGHSNRDMAELLTHELGHTLGLGHPCGDAGLVACLLGTLLDLATMRPTVHSDGRGAVLGADDKSGIAFLYPADGAAPRSNTSPGADTSAAPAAASAGGGGAFGLETLCALLLGALLAARLRRQIHPITVKTPG